MKILSITLVFCLLGIIAPVLATNPCYYNGTWYEDGERLGDYVCDCGKWVYSPSS